MDQSQVEALTLKLDQLVPRMTAVTSADHTRSLHLHWSDVQTLIDARNMLRDQFTHIEAVHRAASAAMTLMSVMQTHKATEQPS